MEQLKTILVNIVVIAVLSLILLAANTQYRQWSQMAKGEAAEKAGNYLQAMAAYEAVIHMYNPVSPTTSTAAEKLWQMAEWSEKKGDHEQALITYRALRSSFYSAAWLMQPGKEWIKKCDERIARLVAAQGKR